MSATPTQPPEIYSQAVRDVLAERVRQVRVEGWTAEHDDGHDAGELSDAAACYAAGSIPMAPASRDATGYVPLWPWPLHQWKPKDRRTDLVRAAALLIAEIEREDRASGGAG